MNSFELNKMIAGSSRRFVLRFQHSRRQAWWCRTGASLRLWRGAQRQWRQATAPPPMRSLSHRGGGDFGLARQPSRCAGQRIDSSFASAAGAVAWPPLPLGARHSGDSLRCGTTQLAGENAGKQQHETPRRTAPIILLTRTNHPLAPMIRPPVRMGAECNGRRPACQWVGVANTCRPSSATRAEPRRHEGHEAVKGLVSAARSGQGYALDP